eukprot:989459-Prorocentrum_lima.AAC.1
MTSSLVGSEMCIRDSLFYSDVDDEATTGECVDVPPGGTIDDVPPEYDAVSYTHLTLPTICSV